MERKVIDQSLCVIHPLTCVYKKNDLKFFHSRYAMALLVSFYTPPRPQKSTLKAVHIENCHRLQLLRRLRALKRSVCSF